MTVTDETLDAAARVVAARLNRLLASVPVSDPAYMSPETYGGRRGVEAELAEARAEVDRLAGRE